LDNDDDIKDHHHESADYVIANGRLIDLNELKPERVFYPWGEALNKDKRDPWYTSHYQALTKGIDGIDYTTWYQCLFLCCHFRKETEAKYLISKMADSFMF